MRVDFLRLSFLGVLACVLTGCSEREKPDTITLEPPSEQVIEDVNEEPPKPQPSILYPQRGTVDNVITAALTKHLERETGFKVLYDQNFENWRIICGLPLNSVGERIDYTTTPYQNQIEKGHFDDGFCALLKSDGQTYQITEFELGGTDNPIPGWSIKHQFKMDE